MKDLKEEIYLEDEELKNTCDCDCPMWPGECSDFISSDH